MKSPGKLLYQLAWKARTLTHFLLPLAARQKIHGWLFQATYGKAAQRQPAATARAPDHFPPGLNVVGYLHAELGVGEAARSTLRACRATGIPAALIDYRKGTMSRMGEQVDFAGPRTQTYNVNLFHINADQMPYAVAELDETFFQRHYNIGVWNWELPELPDDWLESFNYLDEVWVPSRFCHTAVSRKTRLPVITIPYCLNEQPPASLSRAQLGLPENAFLFLFMFDAFSVPERKNPWALIEAFRRAQPRFNRPAALVLKVINSAKATAAMKSIRAAAGGNPAILFLERYLERVELNALFHLCDAYASLHRSEGFGLTMAEAMLAGKPVIATDWSSNTDFMNAGNALPVPYELVTIDQDYGPYKKGQQWAQADVEYAADCMVRLVNEPDTATQLGRAAAANIRAQLSPQAVGQAIRARLAEIGCTV